MEHSKVYRCINYLSTLRGASPTDRKTMFQNVTRLQMASITEVAKRLANGTINPLRRDAQLFERRRLILRTLASNTVSFGRKKALVKRNSALLPSMLRSSYLIQTILDEVQTTSET